MNEVLYTIATVALIGAFINAVIVVVLILIGKLGSEELEDE